MQSSLPTDLFRDVLSACEHMFDHTAAQAFLSLIEDSFLAACNGRYPLRISHVSRRLIQEAKRDRMILLAVAKLRRTGELILRPMIRKPLNATDDAGIAEQPFSFITIAHIKNILFDILADDEPGAHVPADAQSFALPDRVIQHAHMTANDLTRCDIDDVSVLAWQIILQKLAKIPFSDETDPGRILFG